MPTPASSLAGARFPWVASPAIPAPSTHSKMPSSVELERVNAQDVSRQYVGHGDMEHADGSRCPLCLSRLSNTRRLKLFRSR
jgi:ubiquitin C-terminal hydrolase